MGSSCRGFVQASDNQFQNFKRKNQYDSQQATQSDKSNIKKTLSPNSNNQFDKIISFIAHQPNQYFVDPNFKFLQIDSNVSTRSLNKMYNFKKRVNSVFKNQNTPLQIFYQKQVSFCYLTTVFYHICQNRQLKQQIFVTKQLNKYNAYIIHLMCNGKDCNVVVDDTIPTYNNNIKYLNIQPTQQIWPFLLEKAWCKQIGGYDKAKGLSPEDCFQQITGIPTTSFSLKQNSRENNYEIIKNAQQSKYWVAFTAAINMISNGLRSRQVFYLQKIDQQKYCTIRSPYTDFQMPNKKPNKGAIQLTPQQISQNFEYVTIGYYKPDYITTSIPLESSRSKQLFFEVHIKQKGLFNIRISQFYNEYLTKQSKQFYDYSPVLLQLYDDNKKLIDKCGGRSENMQGIRSSHLFQDDFKYLNASHYYLRVQIQQEKSYQINQAALLCYSKPNAIQINRIQHDENKEKQLLQELLKGTFGYQSPQYITNQFQRIKVRHIEKSYGQILGIQSLNPSPVTLSLIFNGSKNIRINHCNLSSNNTLQITLQKQKQQILQILPKDPKEIWNLAPFDIKKI